jgi:nucleotide-binding universal stress UspA family protein
MFTRIVVAVDGTPTANRGLDTAIGVAREHGAALYVVHVIDELAMAAVMSGTAADGASMVAVGESLRASGREILTKAQTVASRALPDVHAEMIDSRGRTVAWSILRFTKRVRGDLIVLGTHGRRGLSRLVMGSDAEAVVREATVPVLLVRGPARRGTHARRSERGGTKRMKAANALPAASPHPVAT